MYSAFSIVVNSSSSASMFCIALLIRSCIVSFGKGWGDVIAIVVPKIIIAMPRAVRGTIWSMKWENKESVVPRTTNAIPEVNSLSDKFLSSNTYMVLLLDSSYVIIRLIM